MPRWLERFSRKTFEENETIGGIVLMVSAFTVGGAIVLICTVALHFTIGRVESLTGWP
jgi:hypothetical protein